MTIWLYFFGLFLLKIVSASQLCLSPDQDCDCSHETWVKCKNKHHFPFGKNLPNSSLFLNLANNHIGPALTSLEAKRVRGLPLESLDLANNRIQIVQKRAFAGLKKLKVLNLNKNKISVLTNRTFYGLNQLLYLYANNMGLRYLASDTFSSTMKLQRIDFENNNLTVIGTQFSKLLDLTTLLLANNKIKFIDSNAFIQQTSLVHLSLFGNKLSFPVSEWFFNIVKNKGSVDMDGRNNSFLSKPNPWICCDSVYRYSQYLKSLKNQSKLFSQLDVSCFSPLEIAGRRVSSLSKKDFEISSCFEHQNNSLNTNLFESNLTRASVELQHAADEKNQVLQRNRIFRHDIFQMIFVFFLLALLFFFLCGFINLAMKKFKNSKDVEDEGKTTCFKKLEKPTTRLFRQDPPSYGITDPVSLTNPVSRTDTSFDSELLSHSSRKRLSIAPLPPNIEGSNEEITTNYPTIESDLSEDEPWSVTDRVDSKDSNH